MSIKQWLRVGGYGFLVWLIPLLLSFFFYNSEGQLSISYDLYKSLMVVVSCLIGSLLLVLYFVQVKSSYLIQGVLLGLLWLALNILLDVLVLMPWMKISFLDYLSQIGLRYVSMPVMSIAVGYLLQRRDQHTILARVEQ